MALPLALPGDEVHWVHVHPQGGEKMGPYVQGKVVSAPIGRGIVQISSFFAGRGRFGGWELLT